MVNFLMWIFRDWEKGLCLFGRLIQRLFIVPTLPQNENNWISFLHLVWHLVNVKIEWLKYKPRLRRKRGRCCIANVGWDLAYKEKFDCREITHGFTNFGRKRKLSWCSLCRTYQFERESYTTSSSRCCQMILCFMRRLPIWGSRFSDLQCTEWLHRM